MHILSDNMFRFFENRNFKIHVFGEIKIFCTQLLIHAIVHACTFYKLKMAASA